MAEKTLEDVIKVLRSNNLDQKGRADQTYAATLSVAQEVATLSTLLKKNFAAQQAAQGDRLEKEREAASKRIVGIDRSKTDNSRTTASNNQVNFMGLGGLGAGLGIGLGAAGAGLGAFFMGLAGAASIMEKFGAGDNLKNLMVNLGEGLKAFGDRELLAVGALLGGSALFVAMPGLGGGDIVVGMGAIGLGIGGFFAGLAASDAAMSYLNVDGTKLKNMMKNLAEGLTAFGDRELIALGAVLGAGTLFSAMPGMGADDIVLGMGAVGLGIGGFFAGLGVGDKLNQMMNVDGENLKKMMKNVAEGLSAFGTTEMIAVGSALLGSALFAAYAGPVAAGAAAIGMTALGGGIAGFITALAGVGDVAGFVGIDGSGFKVMMENLAGGLSAFNAVDDGILEKITGLGGLGLAIAAFFGGSALGSLTDEVMKRAGQAMNFLFGTEYEGDGGERRSSQIKQIVDSLAPLKDLDVTVVDTLDKISDSLDKFTGSIEALADINVDAQTRKFAGLAQYASNIGGLLRAMAKGGTFELEKPGINPKYDFPSGGLLNMDVPVDELEARMKQISSIIAHTGMAPPATAPAAISPPQQSGGNVVGMSMDDNSTNITNPSQVSLSLGREQAVEAGGHGMTY